jgi:hypothetical protein
VFFGRSSGCLFVFSSPGSGFRSPSICGNLWYSVSKESKPLFAMALIVSISTSLLTRTNGVLVDLNILRAMAGVTEGSLATEMVIVLRSLEIDISLGKSFQGLVKGELD